MEEERYLICIGGQLCDGNFIYLRVCVCVCVLAHFDCFSAELLTFD